MLFQTGGLLNVKNLISKAMATKCMFCNELGASINCTKSRCDSSFHFLCGRKANVTFHDNKVGKGGWGTELKIYSECLLFKPFGEISSTYFNC